VRLLVLNVSLNNLSAIPKSSRYAINRQLDRPLYRIGGITGTIAP
jgi:hypothetical protein